MGKLCSSIGTVCLFFALLYSCSKSKSDENNNPGNNTIPTNADKDTLATFPSISETKPQYDNTNFGVYKGGISGSSGFVVFRTFHGNNIAKGYLTVDGRKDTLTTQTAIVLGKSIDTVLFIGKFSSMRLTADSNGNNVALSDILIDGHENVTGIIYHEKSVKQVYCYEGTLSRAKTGTVNLLY